MAQFREAIGDELCKNFSKILTSEANKDFSSTKELINPTLSPKDNLQLIAITSDEEIKNVVFQIG